MLTLWNQFDDLFANHDFWKWPARPERRFLPAVDIRETKDGYVLTADVPGVSAEEIEVSVKDGVLHLKGERSSETKASEGDYQRVERTYGKFERSFVLPKGVDAERIEAHMDDGVLTLTIPKPVAELPRRIDVKVSHEAPAAAEGEHKAG